MFALFVLRGLNESSVVISASIADSKISKDAAGNDLFLPGS